MRNVRIQYLRAAAASAVALYHVSSHTPDALFSAPFDTRFGLYGVSLFFAISGFLMAQLVQSTPPWPFLAHRVLRIYPTYFLVIILFVVLGSLTGNRPGVNGLSLLLAPNDTTSLPIGVEWTLVYETTYYVLLFLLALAGLARHVYTVALLWLCGLLAVFAAAPEWGDGRTFAFHLLLVAPASIPFAGGLLLPALLKRRLVPAWAGLALVPSLLLFGYLDYRTNQLMSGITAVLAVAWAAQEPRERMRGSASHLLVQWGDWSYALYLVHVPVILLVESLWPQGWSRTVLWLVTVGAICTATVPLGRFDVAAYRAMKRRVDEAKARPRAIAVGSYALVYLGVALVGSAITARIQWTLFRLGPHAFQDAETAHARIASAGVQMDERFAGAFESTGTPGASDLVLRGWAVDRRNPSATLRLRAFCSGRPIPVSVSPRKMRPDVAQKLDDPSLRRRRIGFALIPAEREACKPGSEIFIVAFSPSGKAAVIPGVLKTPEPAASQVDRTGTGSASGGAAS